MMSKEKVVELSKSHAAGGFLCSESVLLAISNWLGIRSELIPRIATGFGAGIGGCGSVCGALSGGVMALGLRFGRSDQRREDRRRPYWFARELFERFESEFGHVICWELIGYETSTEDGRKRYAAEKMWETKCRLYIGSVTGMVFDLISENSTSDSSG